MIFGVDDDGNGTLGYDDFLAVITQNFIAMFIITVASESMPSDALKGSLNPLQ